MQPKVIKTEKEYEAALAHVSSLMEAAPGSPEEEELELYGLLVDRYEEEHYPISPPDPIDAILFRIDQEGLTRKDLAKYLGSLGKVSEVLSGKRSLSLAMMRALQAGLGIPASVLLREPSRQLPALKFNHYDYPFAEMLKRGYFGSYQGSLYEAKGDAEELLSDLFRSMGGDVPQIVYCRKADREVDLLALTAWQARAAALAQSQQFPPSSAAGIDESYIRKVVQLSYFSEGHTLVCELLQKRGIHFVILRHLPRTYLDGASFLSATGAPIIAMTLRHDRLDHFWFTLIHELAHLRLHLSGGTVAFFDDTERDDCGERDPREDEANRFARDMLIDKAVWAEVGPSLVESPSRSAVSALAEQLQISPAVVAGRLRWELKDYTVLSDQVGSQEVRKVFPEYN